MALSYLWALGLGNAYKVTLIKPGVGIAHQIACNPSPDTIVGNAHSTNYLSHLSRGEQKSFYLSRSPQIELSGDRAQP